MLPKLVVSVMIGVLVACGRVRLRRPGAAADSASMTIVAE